MTIKDFKKLILTVGVPVYHDEALKQPGSYIVWSEYQYRGFSSDNRRGVKTVRIQVDYYTLTEDDGTPVRIEEIFNRNYISYEDPTRDFDPDTKYTRYIYDCEVILDG